MTATAMPAAERMSDTVAWRPFPGFDGLYYWVLSVDRSTDVVDMMMKFDPNAKCVQHLSLIHI